LVFFAPGTIIIVLTTRTPTLNTRGDGMPRLTLATKLISLAALVGSLVLLIIARTGSPAQREEEADDRSLWLLLEPFESTADSICQSLPGARDFRGERLSRALAKTVDDAAERLFGEVPWKNRRLALGGLKQINLTMDIIDLDLRIIDRLEVEVGNLEQIVVLNQNGVWEVKEPEVAAGDLRRGLVTTYRDNAKPNPVEITRLEPTVALSLKAGESPHPRLAADGGTAVWKGHLNVLRAGKYRFQVMLRGTFRLQVAGKEVLAGDVKDAKTALVEGAEVQLEAGVQPFVAEFTRLPGDARVELSWQSPQFRLEALPFDLLGHLPTQTPPGLKTDSILERGRLLAEEANCVRCHKLADGDRMAKGLAGRQGPDLSQVGKRVHAGWMERWLKSPQQVRAGAAMPEMFSDDEAGRVERYAVTRYLASLSGPVPAEKRLNPKDAEASRNRGERLYGSTGCTACHGPMKKEDRGLRIEDREEKGDAPPSAIFYSRSSIYPLGALGSKTTPERLADYLQNPLTVDPSGRMPQVPMQPKEALDLAHSLCQAKEADASTDLPPAPARDKMREAFKRVDPRAEELAAFEKLPADAQWVDLGKRLVIDKGCNNCHTIAPGGKPFANVLASAGFDDLKAPEKQEGGCLAEDEAKRGKAPRFAFTKEDREALRAFLRDGLQGAGSPAPAYAARMDLQRFNCLACHGRDGEGGLTPELTEQLRKYENADNAEAVSPPPLTGVGHKLRTGWLRQVLVGGARARPWMGLRMPQFGEANVGRMPEALAALEGTEPSDEVHLASLLGGRVGVGRRLVGKTGFGCISCHDLAGHPNTGTRGPDLAGMSQRVRYDWYLRWLEQAQRMQPGTRMPTVFLNGKSQLDTLLNGSAADQAEAMWGYLSFAATMPLPEGMEKARGMLLTATDRPVVLRTFLPDAGNRAIAVGFPGGVSAAFDAQTCRLAFAWSGEFLDASPLWANRGGAPAKILGARFWTAPPGCPVALTTSHDPPSFGDRAKDPAYGASLPEGRLYAGPMMLHFEGYTTDKDGVPTFRYCLQADTDHKAEIQERIVPLRADVAVGVGRRFRLQVPARQAPWLLVGETKQTPRLLDAKGAALTLDLKTERVEVPTEGRLLVLPQDGGRVIVLGLAAAPEGSRWFLQKVGGTWQALLRVPAPTKDGEVRIDLNAWEPLRDEPALLKELATAK
jgi:mono/diheme cytochrome c family protein